VIFSSRSLFLDLGCMHPISFVYQGNVSMLPSSIETGHGRQLNDFPSVNADSVIIKIAVLLFAPVIALHSGKSGSQQCIPEYTTKTREQASLCVSPSSEGRRVLPSSRVASAGCLVKKYFSKNIINIQNPSLSLSLSLSLWSKILILREKDPTS